MSSRRRSRPGTPAEFNAPSTGRRTPLGALQQNNSAAARHAGKGNARAQRRQQGGSIRSGRSQSLPDIGEGSKVSTGEVARRRPRPGRKSGVTLDLLREAPVRSHPLGPHRPGSVGSSDGPRHATTNDLWYSRWKKDQPDPSFDIDGDGTVSSFDMAVAREFDKDGNGILDRDETRLLRTALAKKSLAQYSELPHGPQVASLVAKNKSDVVDRPQIHFEPGMELDPDSQTWHHTMNQLQSKIQKASHAASKKIQPGIYHTEMAAGNLNHQAEAVGGRRGIASLIGGAGEVNHDGHRDEFNEDLQLWIDRKDGGKHIDNNAMLANSDDPIIGAYQDNEGYADRQGMEMKLHDAAHEAYDNMRAQSEQSTRASVHLDGAKPGKLAGQHSHDGVNPKAIRRLFNQMDVDNSGTLDEGEVELLCATAGKRLTKRQLHEAMRSMDADGSGEIEFDEFQNWWIHGVMHPPKGSEVFRQLTEKLEAKCKNVRTLFRKMDENADGTVSQHEFRKGIANLGINVSDEEFAELMETLDEDNSNEIDYNEFANSGVLGGKFFAARNPKGFSGMNTQKEVIEKRRTEYKDFADKKVDDFWQQFNSDPAIATRNIAIAGGTGSGF